MGNEWVAELPYYYTYVTCFGHETTTTDNMESNHSHTYRRGKAKLNHGLSGIGVEFNA